MPIESVETEQGNISLTSPEIQAFVSERLLELRKRLLDASRRNPLINVQFRPTTTSLLRVVDELPDVLRYNLTNSTAMRLTSLPALEEELPDEKTDEFLDMLFLAREEDEEYLKAVEKIDPASEKAEEVLLKIERELKDRIRENLGLAARQTKDAPNLTQHAKNHGIEPSYSLPLPEDEHEDGRHSDTDIQTLLLPDKLTRVAKGILEKSRSFERETGVNVLHAAFGLLEWKDPAERANFVSPLLLLEIRFERRQSPRGAQFYVSGVDRVAINTTLAQKLFAEHRLSIPDYEGGSVEDYFLKVADEAPKGWHWKVRREVVFGIFPSSKIAMYHDLDPEKRAIAQNEVVAKLMASSGGGDGSYAEVYETDNPEVSKKVPYLVLDADASQYSALVDVANGQNLSIEGPPGSGKSQSIVNLIAAALADGKKVLFVAEKLTALDVVKNRLEAADLGEFILPLQASRGTREKIYESLEERLALGRGVGGRREAFVSRQGALERRRAILQGYLDALGSQFGTTGMTVYRAIGHGISTAETREGIPKAVRRIRIEGAETFGPEAIDALVGDAESLAERLGRISCMPKLWLASNAAVMTRDDAEDAGDAAGHLAEDLDRYARDITASGLAPILAASPFATDLFEVEKLLKTVSAEAEKIDSALVEALTNLERRRVVRTLCGQIQERQTALARLSRKLQDPLGWNIGKRIDAARAFAAQHDSQVSPRMHSEIVESLKEKISAAEALLTQARELSAGWTARDGATLSTIRDQASSLVSYPKEIRSLRLADESSHATQLAEEINDTIHTLANELGHIRQGLPGADNHDPDHLRETARSISRAGAFRFLSGDFKKSKNIYRNILRGRAEDDRATMARRLEIYASWLDRRRSFEADIRFAAVYGDLFKGLATDQAMIARAADFYSCCQRISGDDQTLQRALETGDLAPIAAIAAVKFAPDMTVSELEDYRRTQERLLTEEKSLREEAEGHIGLFKDRETIDLAEIDEIFATNKQVEELTSLIEASEAATPLGDRFAGVETKIDKLQVECALAETLAAAPDPALAISILRSGTAPDLLEQLKVFQSRREEIEKAAITFWSFLDLGDDFRSTAALHERIADLRAAAADADALLDRAQLRRSEATLRSQGFDVLVDWVLDEDMSFDPTRLGPIVRSIIAKSMVDRVYEIHSDVLQGYDGHDFDRIREEIAKKDRELIKMSRKVIRDELLSNARPPRGNSIGKKSTYTNMSLIINEMNKKRNRIGARELTRRAGEALLEIKPCWMMSPLAVAQYLHAGMQFDLVVIDEASQMTPENAIGALSRAGKAVIVGDTKQLPPTSFFQKMLDEGDVDEDIREDSESILDMANIAFMPIRQLRWHYRSRHSGLIQFSNQTMYKGELTIFPSAQEDHPDLGVDLIEVPGIYKSRRNEVEARAVVSAAVRHMKESPGLSLGICTMNSDQKDLILEEFERERDRNTTVQAYIARWEEENGALEEFFIKNLETIQGDERDVIFIATLYGPETLGGRVLQRFGPINSAQGHRRLNVLFSRAKRKMVTFTSLKPSDIIVDGAKNYGVQMFRAWLEYCKTGYIAGTERMGGETESPFEDYVLRQIEAMGCEVVPQVGVSGFRIDLGVRHPDWPYGFILGVECDGATYHSSKSSRDRDRLRQEVLEGLGWKLHRIWSTDWFRNPKTEIDTLREVINTALELVKRSGKAPRARMNSVAIRENNVQNIEPLIEPGDDPTGSAISRPRQESLPIEPQDDLFSSADAAKDFGMEAASTEPVIKLGSKVKIENVTDGGRKLAFTLVEGNNDPDMGLVGVHTPLGAALVDAQIWDEVEYQVGSHIKEVRVLEID